MGRSSTGRCSTRSTHNGAAAERRHHRAPGAGTGEILRFIRRTDRYRALAAVGSQLDGTYFHALEDKPESKRSDADASIAENLIGDPISSSSAEQQGRGGKPEARRNEASRLLRQESRRVFERQGIRQEIVQRQREGDAPYDDVHYDE